MPKPADKSPLVELMTSGCRGYCPVYKVRIFNNGDLFYEGFRFVEKVGVVTTGITPEELKSLQAQVAAVNLWQYPERIESRVMDAPSATLTVFKGGQSHAVLGTIDRPKALLDLEQTIKQLTEGHGIRVIMGVAPDVTAPATDKELIVQLKEGVNAGNWIMKFEDLHLRLVRQTSANVWLVAYKPGEIKESDLIELVKGSGQVIQAQPNDQTKDRH